MSHAGIKNTLPLTALFPLSVLLVLVTLAASWYSFAPATAQKADAPAAMFSGERAHRVLSHLLQEDAPHPAGSGMNRRVRDRIVALLKSYGYEPEIQKGFGHVFFRRFAYADNIIARLPGSAASKKILVLAHYDSVPAGPGASDDGIGTAALLEIARALKTLPKMRYSFVFLFTDAEEFGLLGADAYIKDNPGEMQEIEAVFNIDPGCPTGPAVVVQRGPNSGGLEKIMLRANRHRVCNSIVPSFHDVYPDKNSDFYRFIQENKPGIFIGSRSTHLYHTPGDAPAVISPDTLQDIGERILNLLKELGNRAHISPDIDKRVYFDLLSLWVISWPERLTPSIAGASFAMLFATVFLFIRRKESTVKQVMLGIVISIVTTGLSALAGLGINGLIPTLAHSAEFFPANIQLAQILIWAVPFFIGLLTFFVLGRFSNFQGLWGGAWIFLSLCAAATHFWVPGAAYVTLLPALAAGVTGLAATSGGEKKKGFSSGAAMYAVTLLPLFLVCLTIFSAIRLIQASAGLRDLHLQVIFLSFCAIALAPPLVLLKKKARMIPPAVLGLVLVIAGIGLALSSPYNERVPLETNILYLQDVDQGAAHWLFPDHPGLPGEFLRQAQVKEEKSISQPYGQWFASSYFTNKSYPGYVGKATATGAPPPALEVLENVKTEEGRKVILHLWSQRKANELILLFPPGFNRLKAVIEGQEYTYSKEPLSRWAAYEIFGVPESGVNVELTFTSKEEVTVYMMDCEFSLPPQDKELLHLRPAWTTPRHRGDRWYIIKKVVF